MTPKLSLLHEAFIEQARRPMDLGRNPITPREPVPVLVPIDKWQKKDGRLVKTFKFRRDEDRVRFVVDLMEYEDQVRHHAEIKINESEVSLSLITKGVDEVTERDTEYSAYADALFKDCVYSP